MRLHGVWIAWIWAVALTDCSVNGSGTDTVDNPVMTGDAQVADAEAEGSLVRPAGCGDGKLDPGEACDTGPARSDAIADACRTNCSLHSCGDGVIDSNERCDTGPARTNSTPNACRLDCQLFRCGDGVIDSGEECDTGDARSNSVADACRLSCKLPRCGDGVIDKGEGCDDAKLNDLEPNACRTHCMPPSCGDGVVDQGEACDTGRATLSDTLADACRSTCVTPRCGDGVRDKGEACDDGDTVDNNGCRNDCATPFCGDGKLDPGEQCDDANRWNADGCQSTCLTPVCGDGVVDPGELCDDRNTFENDGCLSTCKLGCINAADCALMDSSRCAPDQRSFVRIMGACNRDGSCGSVTESSNCTLGVPQCMSGKLVTFSASCNDINGCVAPVANAPQPCPVQAPTCTKTNTGFRYTTFRAACTDEQSCDPAGSATNVRCNDAVSCNGGKLLVTTATCAVSTGCAATSITKACEVPDSFCRNGKRVTYTVGCNDDKSACGKPVEKETNDPKCMMRPGEDLLPAPG